MVLVQQQAFGTICAESWGKVRSHTEGGCLGYIQSTAYLADIALRGIGVKQLKEWKLWSTGPSFLRQLIGAWKVGLDIFKAEVCQEDVNTEAIVCTATFMPNYFYS